MYATNPLLPSESKPEQRGFFSSSMAQKWNKSRMRQMIVSTKPKRIVPSPTSINSDSNNGTQHDDCRQVEYYSLRKNKLPLAIQAPPPPSPPPPQLPSTKTLIATKALPQYHSATIEEEEEKCPSSAPPHLPTKSTKSLIKSTSKATIATIASITSITSSPVTERDPHEGPTAYYNGFLETLDQFSHERLTWLLQSSSVENHLPQWKDPKSVVFHKPHIEDKPLMIENPLAMVYLRVIDIVRSTSAKASTYYCTVQVNDQICTGKHVTSIKYGKQSGQAEIDEVYLLDLDRPAKVTFSLYTESKTSLLNGRKKNTSDICIGQRDFHWSLHPVEKQVGRVTFLHEEDTYQVMLVYGTFMNERAQALVANQPLHKDFLTVYIRGNNIPRWQRFWAVLYATHLSLHDFEYKETKVAQVDLPLYSLEGIFHPCNTDDDEQTIDVGRLGLALQFSTQIQRKRYAAVTENRMYVLPDNNASSRQWEKSLGYCVSLIEEFRPPPNKLTSATFSKDAFMIPNRFLW